jgi:hypothetical protein
MGTHQFILIQLRILGYLFVTMTILFDRRVGAAADVSELDYVSALHQTDPSGVRTDGSIRGKKGGSRLGFVKHTCNSCMMSLKK